MLRRTLGNRLKAWVGGPSITPGALIETDLSTVFYYDGDLYPDLASWLAALGGTAAGSQISVGPYRTGVFPYVSDFSTTDGWATGTGTGSVGAVGGELVVTAGATGYRPSRATSLAGPAGFEASITKSAIAGVATNTSASSGATLGANATTASASHAAPPSTRTALGGVSSAQSTAYVGSQTTGTGTANFSAASIQTVHPYNGFQQGQFSFYHTFTMPGSSGTDQVLDQWGTGAENNRIRLIWQADTHLHLICTVIAVGQADLDLGPVAAGASGTIKVTVAPNAFYASLDGGPLVSDTSATFPGITSYWLNRSLTGDAFAGTTNRIVIFPTAQDPVLFVNPLKAFSIFGDSTAAGVGATTTWFVDLTQSYTPARAYNNQGVGGESSTQMLARVAATPAAYLGWDTIFMDRPNTGEDPTTWLNNMKAAVGYLTSPRWFVMPPAQDVPDTSIANITTVQQALLSDPFFAGHTLAAAEQAAYLAAVNDAGTRSDGLHFNDAGQAIQGTYIKTFYDAQGW